MALPVGIQTCEVTFGPFMNFAGQPATGRVTFAPSRSLVWLATGTPLLPDALTATLDDDGQGFIYLPYTNQAGFGDGKGNAVTNWSYRATFYLQTSRQPAPIAFNLPLGTPAVDLDVMGPAVPATPGVTALPMISWLVLGPTDPIPPGLPANTVIVRRS